MARRVLPLIFLLLLALPAWGGELAGVTVPDSITVDGTKLVLNGLGLRKKAIFKVYVGALYLPQRSSDPAAIIALEAPKRMEMHFVRSVGKDKIADAWREGFANNSAAKLPELQQRLDEFASKWVDMKDGDAAAMTYVGGGVLKLEIQGKEVGVFQGKEFADAVFACWLGPKPPSEDLKKGVLGE
ncbi:MAG: chalcone isomerase family protein [Acidobacteriota bacterium]